MAYIGYANDLIDFMQKTIKKTEQIAKQVNTNIKQQSKFNPKPPPQNLKEQLTRLELALAKLREKVALIKDAPKFRLPYNADLFTVNDDDSVKSFSDRMCGGMLNLPFKQIVIEYEDGNGFQVALYEDFDTYIGFVVTNINPRRENQFIGHENNYLLEKSTGDVTLNEDLINLSETGKEHLTEIGVAYGARPLLQLLSALNCSNVAIEDDLENVPSPTKQAMRKSKGKLPLFSYKVLTINTHIDANSRDIEYSDEKGAPKRSHLRRGHIRKYKTGKQIWINSMAVGLKGHGEIEKSYKVK